MEYKHWLKVTTKETNKEQVTADLVHFARNMIDNAFEHGYFVDHLPDDKFGITSFFIVKSMLYCQILFELKDFTFYREWLLENHNYFLQMKQGCIDHIYYAFSSKYPISWGYMHFVTREIDYSKYVDRSDEMISPEWDDAMENQKYVELFISERMKALEMKELATNESLTNIIQKINKNSFEKMIYEIKDQEKCSWSYAIVEAFYRTMDALLVNCSK